MKTKMITSVLILFEICHFDTKHVDQQSFICFLCHTPFKHLNLKLKFAYNWNMLSGNLHKENCIWMIIACTLWPCISIFHMKIKVSYNCPGILFCPEAWELSSQRTRPDPVFFQKVSWADPSVINVDILGSTLVFVLVDWNRNQSILNEFVKENNQNVRFVSVHLKLTTSHSTNISRIIPNLTYQSLHKCS